MLLHHESSETTVYFLFKKLDVEGSYRDVFTRVVA